MANIDFGDPIGEFIAERRARKTLRREEAFRTRQQTSRELGSLGATAGDIEAGRRLSAGEVPVSGTEPRRQRPTEFPADDQVGQFITEAGGRVSPRGERQFTKAGGVVPASPEERRQAAAFEQFSTSLKTGGAKGRTKAARRGVGGVKTSDLRQLKKDLETKKDDNPRAFSRGDEAQLEAVNKKLSGRVGAKKVEKEESLFDRIKRRQAGQGE